MATCTYDDISIGLRDNSWKKLSFQDVQAFLGYLSIPDVVTKAAPLLRPVAPATMPRTAPSVAAPRPSANTQSAKAPTAPAAARAATPAVAAPQAAAPTVVRTLDNETARGPIHRLPTTTLSPLQETVYNDFAALSPESEETWKPLESSFAYLMLASRGRRPS